MDTKKSEFVRVLKIATKEVCLMELEGFLITQEKQLDLFSQVGYVPADEFSVKGQDSKYGILLYQDVGTLAAGDLKGVEISFRSDLFRGSE